LILIKVLMNSFMQLLSDLLEYRLGSKDSFYQFSHNLLIYFKLKILLKSMQNWL